MMIYVYKQMSDVTSLRKISNIRALRCLSRTHAWGARCSVAFVARHAAGHVRKIFRLQLFRKKALFLTYRRIPALIAGFRCLAFAVKMQIVLSQKSWCSGGGYVMAITTFANWFVNFL